MSEYQFVQKSKLKLKKEGVAEGSGVVKRKKKSKKESDATLESPSTASEKKDLPEHLRGKTKTEIAFLKRKEKLDADRIKKKASVSHKERVEKFNEYLNNLSEHYEPAKVSWTK